MKVPEPITREDMYLSYLTNGEGSLPQPITRKEMYLYYLCVNGFGSGGGSPDMELTNQSAGTSVGEIISYMGTVAPANYLICDGSVYQISDYPYLAQHFVDNFGTVDYFGGDGTDTFAVPDLRGEFLRGTGTADRNTGIGESVGVHQDPTSHAYVQSNGSGSVFCQRQSIISDMDTRNNGNVTLAWGASSINENDAGVTTYTSRPTNTSVLYLIKYQPTYWITPTNLSEEGTA